MSGLLAYIPFVTPLPVWNYWAWLLVPLCAAVAIVYKTIKCRYVHEIPRQAAAITVWIIVSMIAVAAGIWAVYQVMVVWAA